MRIVLACNCSDFYKELPLAQDDKFEEFDSIETINSIAQTIESFGHTVKVLEADKSFPEKLVREKPDFVFNIAEGLYGRCRESQVPALCEMMEIPYSGSDAITLGISLEKSLAKSLLEDKIPISKGKVFAPDSKIDFGDLKFPVIVKPDIEGSSKGIRNTSKTDSHKKAETLVKEGWKNYGCPMLVEEFLEGPECTVGVIGNKEPKIIGIMEIAPVKTSVADFIYSLETKRDYLNQVEYRVPPQLPKDTLKELESYALTVFKTLKCRDLSRIDFRLDREGKPHFLEINPLPGLSPQKSDIVILAKSMGWEYRKLIGEVLRQAFSRYGLN